MSVTRVIGVVVDTKLLTVYKADGKSVEISQGDPRVPQILEALPKIEKQGYAYVELEAANPYRDFEQKSGGLVRFFKVAKNKVAGLFGSNEVPTVKPQMVGKVPNPEEPMELTTRLSQADAVADIMANAEPIGNLNSEESDPEIGEDETVVAVTGGKAIPNQEMMKEHIRHHSGKAGSTKGMENFYARITPIIDKRGHSVEDLLRFMEKNDLPIADDGCLIVYKVLRRNPKNKEGYVDCHTRNVQQRIGSFVCVDEKLVDKNRRNECSNGLHVARRGYIGGFSGDICTIVKVAPEDVITVPHGDPNKVRVCGYHIIMELENDAWQLLKKDRPMTENPKAQKMLARAIVGDHIGRIETVQIGSGNGGNITITPIEKSQQKDAPKPKPEKVEPAKALDHDGGGRIDSTKTTAQAAAIIKTGSATQAMSRQEQARKLCEQAINGQGNPKAAQELLAIKRSAKVSWATLGIGGDTATRILQIAATAPAELQQPIEETVTVVETPAPVEQPAASDAAPVAPVKRISHKARLFELDKILNSEDAHPAHQASAAAEMLVIRSKMRKSWGSLGYPKLTDQFLNSEVDRLNIAAEKRAKETPPAAQKAIQATKAVGKAKKNKKAATAPTTLTGTLTGSRKEIARILFVSKRWSDLAAFKKKVKISWTSLGFSNREVDQIKLHIGD